MTKIIFSYNRNKNLGINRQMYFFTRLQLLFTILLTSTLLFWGRIEAMSALYGGLTAIIPSYLFAKKIFKCQSFNNPQHIVKNFYIGEVLKIGSSILLFVFVFISCTIYHLVFILSYIFVVMSHWCTLLIFKHTHYK